MKKPKTAQEPEPLESKSAAEGADESGIARIVAHLVAVLRRARKARNGAKQR